MCLVLWDFNLLECSYDAGPAASCRTLQAHVANWIWAAFQLKPEMELGNVIRTLEQVWTEMKTQRCLQFWKCLTDSQDLPWRECVWSAADTSGEGRQRIEAILYESDCKLHVYNKMYCSARMCCNIYNHTFIDVLIEFTEIKTTRLSITGPFNSNVKKKIWTDIRFYF